MLATPHPASALIFTKLGLVKEHICSTLLLYPKERFPMSRQWIKNYKFFTLTKLKILTWIELFIIMLARPNSSDNI